MAGNSLPEVVRIRDEASLPDVRRAIDGHCRAIGFGLIDHTKLLTAASELARNILLYAGSGSVSFEEIGGNSRIGLRMTFKDHGPGIGDLALAMQDGYTTGTGMGLGLPGTKRLVHEFSIDSVLGGGTRVSIVQWKR